MDSSRARSQARSIPLVPGCLFSLRRHLNLHGDSHRPPTASTSRTGGHPGVSTGPTTFPVRAPTRARARRAARTLALWTRLVVQTILGARIIRRVRRQNHPARRHLLRPPRRLERVRQPAHHRGISAPFILTPTDELRSLRFPWVARHVSSHPLSSLSCPRRARVRPTRPIRRDDLNARARGRRHHGIASLSQRALCSAVPSVTLGRVTSPEKWVHPPRFSRITIRQL